MKLFINNLDVWKVMSSLRCFICTIKEVSSTLKQRIMNVMSENKEKSSIVYDN